MSGVVTIIARKVEWPSQRQRTDRGGLRLRWDALTEGGDLLFAATEYPFADGAYALLQRGVDPETRVTMRHDGALCDSFDPMPLHVAAAPGASRAEKRADFAAKRAAGLMGTAASPSGGA